MIYPRVIDSYVDTKVELTKGNWFIAKPFEYCLDLSLWGQRFCHAWLVLTGKATAVVFAEDVKKKK